jgi:hypothetical protein
MAVTTTPALPQTPQLGVTQLAHAQSANTLVTVATAGTNGSKVNSVWATNTDPANAYLTQVWLTRSGTNFLLGTVNVPVSAGNTAAAPSVNIFGGITGLPLDSDGNPYVYLQSGDVLAVSATTQVASSQTLTVASNFASF